MAKEERRKTRRIKLTQLAQTQPDEEKAETDSTGDVLGITADLSNGGVRFETPQNCEVGSQVTISFVLGGKIVDAKGDVVHFSTKKDGVASMGIRFRHLSQADRKFIEKYCRMRERLE